ncbi:hypothetical protein QA601_12565 [Chitinispirillales bacterium ANBcel5]|uniref:TolB family protein n=1 Tax=Cellulosispirillum alkaliphilum TaxID=3039283 RepID=UPI002A4F1436|nr:hypothetical protein [Chitinispirillales bacterium ANBcel5]
MKNNLVYVTFYLIFTIANAASNNITHTVLHENMVLQDVPGIYGNYVYFQDWRSFYDISKLNHQTGSSVQVRQGTKLLYPLVFGGEMFAWIDYTESNGFGMGPGETNNVSYYVKIHKLNTGEEVTVTTDAAYKEHIAVYGQKVVWTDYRHFSPGDTTVEIYMYDVDQGVERRITTAAGYKSNPHIHENRIVWQDYRNGSSDIYLYDLTTNQEIAITNNRFHQANPFIYNSKIVWEDNRNGAGDPDNFDIYLFDLETTSENQIYTGSGYQGSPQISEQLVVWQDFGLNGDDDASNSQIVALNLNTKEKILVSENMAGYMGEPRLWENVVVWQNYNDGNLWKAEVENVQSSISVNRNRNIPAAQRSISNYTIYDLSGRKIDQRSASGVFLKTGQSKSIKIRAVK